MFTTHIIKKLGFSRAEDIINTANKNFPKYYSVSTSGILFWISDNPYRKYFIDLEGWQPEVQTQHFSYFVDLLKSRGFKEYKKIVNQDS